MKIGSIFHTVIAVFFFFQLAPHNLYLQIFCCTLLCSFSGLAVFSESIWIYVLYLSKMLDNFFHQIIKLHYIAVRSLCRFSAQSNQSEAKPSIKSFTEWTQTEFNLFAWASKSACFIRDPSKSCVISIKNIKKGHYIKKSCWGRCELIGESSSSHSLKTLRAEHRSKYRLRLTRWD